MLRPFGPTWATSQAPEREEILCVHPVLMLLDVITAPAAGEQEEQTHPREPLPEGGQTGAKDYTCSQGAELVFALILDFEATLTCS